MSASQLLYGTPAKLAVAPYSGLVTLGGAGTFSVAVPFPVSGSTIALLTAQGAATGALYYTKVNGVPGVGSVTVTSAAGAADANKIVAVSIWNQAAEGF
jgi:hypothetical protein